MAELKTVPLESIDVPEVRVSSIMNEEQHALLASTVKEIGVVQDIVVRPKGPDRYELIAGNTDP